ncbi:MFS transporter [Actinokineospora sp. NBRC 105648]|uniref:MFS transporter n=1 Tax=Actinokineospora sp. NBRC 105648 TaxID=3032206 RepID=UPI002552AB42|nr:MFS transporter [Actinokineospora sp. NBRC 105648]
MTTNAVGTPTTEVLGGRLRWSLAVDQGLGCLGLYSVLPVLGVLLASGSSAAFVGIGLFSYSASAGLSAMLLNRWLTRLTYLRGMAGSMVLSGVAFGLLPHVSSPIARCGLLVVAGLGVSVHFLMSRVLVAEELRSDIGRNRMYSMLQIAVNVAAAVGPFIGGFLILVDARLLLATVAACYVLAGVALFFGVPADLRPAPAVSRWPISREVLRWAVVDPPTRRLVLIGATGAFVYGHFYSAIALLVARDFAESKFLRGALIAGPALAIAVFQGPVTVLVTRLMRGGATPFTVLVHGTVIFTLALVTLGLDVPVLWGTAVAVALFALAEMVFTPMQSTAFAGLAVQSKFEAFNLRQVCWTVGEALGSLAGGSVFLTMYHDGLHHTYWLVLAVLVFAVTVALAWTSRARPALR